MALHIRFPKFHCSSDPDGTTLPSTIPHSSSYCFMPLSFKISLLKQCSVGVKRELLCSTVGLNLMGRGGWGGRHPHFIFPEEQCEISNPQL